MTEIMGYATKTAAVLAMREQGKGISEIARILGISENAASGLESCAKRARNRSAKRVSLSGSTVADLIPLTVRQRLRPHAAKRGVSTDRLIADLDGHFVLSNGGKLFVRIMTINDDEEVASSEFCLSDIAEHAARRMSK